MFYHFNTFRKVSGMCFLVGNDQTFQGCYLVEPFLWAWSWAEGGSIALIGISRKLRGKEKKVL